MNLVKLLLLFGATTTNSAAAAAAATMEVDEVDHHQQQQHQQQQYMPRGLRNHPMSQQCDIIDLVTDCAEEVLGIDEKGFIDFEAIHEEVSIQCEVERGMLAAACVLKYICEEYGKEQAISIYPCVKQVCPMAKHIDPKVACGRP